MGARGYAAVLDAGVSAPLVGEVPGVERYSVVPAYLLFVENEENL